MKWKQNDMLYSKLLNQNLEEQQTFLFVKPTAVNAAANSLWSVSADTRLNL